MKLKQIQEAKYAYPNYALWVEEHLTSKKRYNAIHTKDVDAQVALKQIIAKYGPPPYTDEDGEYWEWHFLSTNDQIPVGAMLAGHNLTLWAEGPLELHFYILNENEVIKYIRS